MIKVLVVEDDPMVGKLHEHYLTQIKGFQLCDIVRNSDEALKIMQTKSTILSFLIFLCRNGWSAAAGKNQRTGI